MRSFIRGRSATLALLGTLCVLFGASVSTTGCACEDYMAPNLALEVVDSITGQRLTGVTGEATHSSGAVDPILAGFDGYPFIVAAGERAGRWTVTVRKPGYVTQVVSGTVEDNMCHVETRAVTIRMRRENFAVPEVPLAFNVGPRTNVSRASAGVQVRGDTLVIAGSAGAPCAELVLTAIRSRQVWHIQLEPSAYPRDCQSGIDRLHRQFEARFKLQPGINYILITTANEIPTTLFAGQATPNASVVTLQ